MKELSCFIVFSLSLAVRVQDKVGILFHLYMFFFSPVAALTPSLFFTLRLHVSWESSIYLPLRIVDNGWPKCFLKIVVTLFFFWYPSFFFFYFSPFQSTSIFFHLTLFHSLSFLLSLQVWHEHWFTHAQRLIPHKYFPSIYFTLLYHDLNFTFHYLSYHLRNIRRRRRRRRRRRDEFDYFARTWSVCVCLRVCLCACRETLCHLKGIYVCLERKRVSSWDQEDLQHLA